jgi:hypothetical protein
MLKFQKKSNNIFNTSKTILFKLEKRLNFFFENYNLNSKIKNSIYKLIGNNLYQRKEFSFYFPRKRFCSKFDIFSCRLEKFRDLMKDRNLDCYVLPRSDQHNVLLIKIIKNIE